VTVDGVTRSLKTVVGSIANDRPVRIAGKNLT
jgi:hypothetical protein